VFIIALDTHIIYKLQSELFVE